MQTYLPDDLNPKIKEQLDNGMGGPPNGPPGPPPPAASSSAAATAPAKKQAANSSKKKSEGEKAAAQQQAAAAAQRSQPQAQDHALPGRPVICHECPCPQVSEHCTCYTPNYTGPAPPASRHPPCTMHLMQHVIKPLEA